MAQTSRPLVAVVIVAFVLVAAYLLIAQPQPQPPSADRSNTPLAPLQAIPQAQGAAAASDAANRRLQAAGEQLDSP